MHTWVVLHRRHGCQIPDQIVPLLANLSLLSREEIQSIKNPQQVQFAPLSFLPLPFHPNYLQPLNGQNNLLQPLQIASSWTNPLNRTEPHTDTTLNSRLDEEIRTAGSVSENHDLEIELLAQVSGPPSISISPGVNAGNEVLTRPIRNQDHLSELGHKEPTKLLLNDEEITDVVVESTREEDDIICMYQSQESEVHVLEDQRFENERDIETLSDSSVEVSSLYEVDKDGESESAEAPNHQENFEITHEFTSMSHSPLAQSHIQQRSPNDELLETNSDDDDHLPTIPTNDSFGSGYSENSDSSDAARCDDIFEEYIDQINTASIALTEELLNETKTMIGSAMEALKSTLFNSDDGGAYSLTDLTCDSSFHSSEYCTELPPEYADQSHQSGKLQGMGYEDVLKDLTQAEFDIETSDTESIVEDNLGDLLLDLLDGPRDNVDDVSSTSDEEIPFQGNVRSPFGALNSSVRTNMTNISNSPENITNMTNITNSHENITNMTNITNSHENITNSHENITNMTNITNSHENITNMTNITNSHLKMNESNEMDCNEDISCSPDSVESESLLKDYVRTLTFEEM